MNFHIPQSAEATVELEEIAAVPHHIITPRHAKPMIGIYQDTLVGSYRLTQPGIEFTRREFMNLMMWNKRFDGIMPTPRGPLVDKPRWTGQQVLGALMPPINMEMGNKSYDSEKDNSTSHNYVKIVQGDITQGVVDGDIYMKPSKGIIHIAYNDCGPKDTVALLDALQNTVENFLVLNGFSVGISDLIADEDTKKLIDTKIQEKKKQVEQVILQVHLDLFDNNTGKTNQQEFEDQIFGILNQATSDAGSTGQQSLSAENRLLAMVRSGSKGEPLNVAQMMACLGQTAIEGKRVPYGFTDRTLPHYKKYDDSSEARGFIESSFIRGLTPQQFFFHAMSGREGLIDTAVKSVTADTEIIIQEDGMTKWTTIGSWIDAHLAAADPTDVEHHEQANMELLNLTNDVFIPTCDEKGVMTWGKMTAVTRHDPGERIYEVTTLGGRHVTVAESKSLIVWDDVSNGFVAKPTPDVKEGDYLPTTVRLSDPPITVTHIDMKRYVTKLKSSSYSLPDQMELTEENGIFFGLYLAEGNSHIKSGYVNIANNDQTIRTFAMNWFTDLGIKVSERFRTVVNPTRTGTTTGVSNGVRGFSRPLGRFLESFLGAGSANKYVPNEAFGAPKHFIRGLLNGYFSGDGTVDVKKGSLTVNSASKKLIEGISFLCSRFGIFGKMSRVQLKSNNVMTPTERILPTYRFSICAKWATLFATEIPLISHEKQERAIQIHHAHQHRNFPSVEDVAKDAIVSIRVLSTEAHPKLYDVTVPSTLNFSIANGLGLADTADTGYIQRQLIKSMEDLTVQHDGTVRDTNNNIIQYHYGEDGVNPTKIETQSLPIGKLSEQEIRSQFGMDTVDWTLVLQEEIVRENEEEMITEYVNQILQDQRMMVEGVFQKKSLDSGSVFAPVNLARWILNIKVRFALKSEKTDLTPSMVLQGIQKIIERTHSYHKIWAALLRFHLAPHKLIVKERFTKVAFETLVDIIVVNHMKSWVQPGEQVGIVAAQSIGEPATQMSEIGSTIICVSDGKAMRYYGSIREFIDPILEKNKEKVQTIASQSVVLPMEDDYYIVGVSEDEKTSWKRISEISRHPANGGIIEVITRTGRKTTATLSHSFLKRSPTGIVPVLGSELEIGMRIPIAKVIPEVPNPLTQVTQGSITFTMNREFGWVCGMYLADGCFKSNTVSISKISPVVEPRLRAFGEQYNIPFTTRDHPGAFGPGKDNNLYSKDLKDFLMDTFGTGSYEKKIGATVFHANKEFIAGVIGGFFDGDGNISVERQLIRASSRSEMLIQQITALLGYVGMFGCMSQETSVRIKDKVQYTLTIPRKFATAYKEQVGFQLPEKAEALDKIIEYNAREDVRSEQEMIDKIPEVGAIIAETGKLLKMPGQSSTYGRWAKKESIGRQTLTKYMAKFEEKCQELGAHAEGRAKIEANMDLLRSALAADVFWDEIVELNEYVDPKEFVYDFTVPGNDSFMVDCNVLVHNTLNTFHQAGVASKSAVTRGVPRLRELLKVTQNPKASSLTIYLKPEYRNNKEKAREVVQDLELTVLRTITNKVAIYWDEKDATTVVEEDKELMRFFALFEQDEHAEQAPAEPLSKWVLRLELNREEMFNRNLSIQEVVSVIKMQFNFEIDIVYSDYNSDKLVMRIRLPNKDKKDKDTASQQDDFTNLKKFQNKLLNSIVIRGLPGIKAVTFRKDSQYVESIDGKYEPVEQYVLDTDGSNFIKVMNHPAVDGTKLYSTNVWDVYEVLGIEATRAILFNEINGLFESVGVNFRHLCLLCDVMTRFGKLMSIDRYGINKNDIGTLAKASFEETEKILLKAALFGEVDPVMGVSANIMMGQPIRGGTAFSQILMDDQVLSQLLKDIDVDQHAHRLEEEKVGDLSQLEETTALTDPCGAAPFQMNMVMPNAIPIMEEPDVEMNIL
jgi:DNA-directed RNA polymerase beta' subunit